MCASGERSKQMISNRARAKHGALPTVNGDEGSLHVGVLCVEYG